LEEGLSLVVSMAASKFAMDAALRNLVIPTGFCGIFRGDLAIRSAVPLSFTIQTIKFTAICRTTT
jgi:hypothetical protein